MGVGGISKIEGTASELSLSIIVAVSENHVIGQGGALPWRLSTDLRRFKRLTMGHCLIMGRKTYESIGQPLRGRVSIVLSRREREAEDASSPRVEGVLHAESFDEAVALVPTTEMARKEAFITGGGEIYRVALPRADRLHITRVHATVKGDSLFPEVDWSDWRLVDSKPHRADDKNDFDCTFEIWERK